MKLFSFASEHGRDITAHGSHGVRLAPILRPSPALHIACFHLEPEGVISRHQAVDTQLLLIMFGVAIVSGDEGPGVSVSPGDAVLWQAGEWHETRAFTHVIAMVLEGEGLADPPGFRLHPRSKRSI